MPVADRQVMVASTQSWLMMLMKAPNPTDAAQAHERRTGRVTGAGLPRFNVRFPLTITIKRVTPSRTSISSQRTNGMVGFRNAAVAAIAMLLTIPPRKIGTALYNPRKRVAEMLASASMPEATSHRIGPEFGRAELRCDILAPKIDEASTD